MNSKFINYIEQLRIKSGFKAQIIQMFANSNRCFTELWGENKDAFISNPIYKQSGLVCEVLPIKKGDYIFICKNKDIFNYVKDNFDSMSDIEKGFMYGYPYTAIQAFMGFIERSEREKTVPMTFIGPGFYSKEYNIEEREYYDKIWKEIKAISPSITKQCEEEYL